MSNAGGESDLDALLKYGLSREHIGAGAYAASRVRLPRSTSRLALTSSAAAANSSGGQASAAGALERGSVPRGGASTSAAAGDEASGEPDEDLLVSTRFYVMKVKTLQSNASLVARSRSRMRGVQIHYTCDTCT